VLASLGSGLGAAHVLELQPRMEYDAALYTAVTSTLYRWFALAGAPIQVGAILSAALLTYLVRGRPAFRWTLAGALCLMLSLVLWATLVQPVNVAWGEALRSGPEAAQAEYMRLRGRWEYGHVAAFLAWLVGLCLLIRSVLVETPRGGTIERAARLSIAACCMLSGIACGGDGGMRMEEEAGRDTVGVAEGGPVREDEPTRADTMVMQVRGSLPRRPVAPLRIDGACPFECCAYGDWTTTGESTLYEEPDPASARWTVPAGTRLEAVSGFVVLTEIGVAVARDTIRMFAEYGAERLAAAGDTLFLLDNVGEGFRRVWHQGSVLQTDAVSGFVSEGSVPAAEILSQPLQEWWAQARALDGRAGWLWMDHTPRMEGADACG
jgi:hypothetical protein